MRTEKRSSSFCVLAFVAGLTWANASVGLEVIRGTEAPIVLEPEQLAQLGSEQVQFGAHDAPPASYTCVSLNRILHSAGVPAGEALRGAELRKVALVEASDGYAVAFSLGELDDALGKTRAVLCWLKDGKPLDEHEGALRLILPADSRAARSVRQVVRIRVVDPVATESATPAPH